MKAWTIAAPDTGVHVAFRASSRSAATALYLRSHWADLFGIDWTDVKTLIRQRAPEFDTDATDDAGIVPIIEVIRKNHNTYRAWLCSACECGIPFDEPMAWIGNRAGHTVGYEFDSVDPVIYCPQCAFEARATGSPPERFRTIYGNPYIFPQEETANA